MTKRLGPTRIRQATRRDLAAIRAIYNEGIEDRIATLDLEPKTANDIERWYAAHRGRYAVLVAEHECAVIGWASLNRYSPRTAYDGVADLSIYVARAYRGRGLGRALMCAIEESGRRNAFHKIVLFALEANGAGKRLYRAAGFRAVGAFRDQGKIDGRFVDVVAMEKLIR